jgi:hypothetical protein
MDLSARTTVPSSRIPPKDLPEALPEEVPVFSEICPWSFASFTSFSHHRFASKEMMNHEHS